MFPYCNNNKYIELHFISYDRGRVDDLSFFDYLNPFCFLLIEFHYTFSIFFSKYYRIMFIIIVFD